TSGAQVGRRRRGAGGSPPPLGTACVRQRMRAWLLFPRSADLTAPEALDDPVDAALGICPVGDCLIGVPARRDPGHQHVEIELADKVEALEVTGTITRREHRGDPLPLVQVDRVAREQEAVLAAVPE